MSYVLAAYGVTLATLVVYGFLLQRERRRLARDTAEGAGRDDTRG